ncbi:hypothetical protein [Streptomyces sp. NPDC003077]|uniref:hypothetical protein n=1 Tax=Streptomyces sp. NPDC003077 TaxID=3154443 RepID=UPI0033A14B47
MNDEQQPQQREYGSRPQPHGYGGDGDGPGAGSVSGRPYGARDSYGAQDASGAYGAASGAYGTQGASGAAPGAYGGPDSSGAYGASGAPGAQGSYGGAADGYGAGSYGAPDAYGAPGSGAYGAAEAQAPTGTYGGHPGSYGDPASSYGPPGSPGSYGAPEGFGSPAPGAYASQGGETPYTSGGGPARPYGQQPGYPQHSQAGQPHAPEQTVWPTAGGSQPTYGGQSAAPGPGTYGAAPADDDGPQTQIWSAPTWETGYHMQVQPPASAPPHGSAPTHGGAPPPSAAEETAYLPQTPTTGAPTGGVPMPPGAPGASGPAAAPAAFTASAASAASAAEETAYLPPQTGRAPRRDPAGAAYPQSSPHTPGAAARPPAPAHPGSTGGPEPAYGPATQHGIRASSRTGGTGGTGTGTGAGAPTGSPSTGGPAPSGPATGDTPAPDLSRLAPNQRARAEGRSPIIPPGIQPAGITAVLALLLAVTAPLARPVLFVPVVLLQAVTAAGWFRLNGMWPARQGIALAFLAGLTTDIALLATDSHQAPLVAVGTLGVWCLFVLILQLRNRSSADERMYALTAGLASTALAVLAAGHLAAAPDAVVAGAAGVALATLARALPLPSAASVVVALVAGAGAGIAAGGLTGLGAAGALVGLVAGGCALIGLRVASYDYPSRFVHMTAGVALPLALAAPAVYVLGRALA